MEAQLEEIRNQQRESWNKFSPGWKKWDKLLMEFLKPVGEEIIRLINPKETDVILDVAAGTGEPGLSIASKSNGCKVVLTDLSEEMLEIAKENAKLRSIANIETHPCDVCELPFQDKTFDSISCRFGFMFFPDMSLALNEMIRVLKPGGKIAASVWNVPDKNFWVTAVTDTIRKNTDFPQPPPGAPGMFRCAKDGLVAELFRQAGLKNVSQHEVKGYLRCYTAEAYWDMMTDVGAPIVALLNKTDDAMKEKIKTEVFLAVNGKFPEGNVIIESSALVIYGEL